MFTGRLVDRQTKGKVWPVGNRVRFLSLSPSGSSGTPLLVLLPAVCSSEEW